MGAVLSSKVDGNGKVIFEVCIDYEEAVQLKGILENVHLFAEDVTNIKTKMSQRGKNDATKYFLIPKQLRDNLRFNDDAFCQRIDTKTKVIFIYVVDKFNMG